MKLLTIVSFVAGVLVLPISAQAATISYGLSSTSISIGDTLNVDVNISGLGQNSALSLGSYDLDVNWDNGYFSYVANSYMRGTQLDPTNFGDDGFDYEFISSVGSAEAYEFSSEAEADLNADQDATFTLFSYSLLATANTVGTVLTGSFNDVLGAADASPITPSTFNNSTSIVISPTAVPLPAGVWLLGSGLLGFVASKRFRKS